MDLAPEAPGSLYRAIYQPMAEGVAGTFASEPAVAAAGLTPEDFTRSFVALVDQESRFNPDTAQAQNLAPINTFFTTLGTALTGATGRAIGFTALAAVGIMFLFGRMNMGFAVSICVGLVILFGAATILSGFA